MAEKKYVGKGKVIGQFGNIKISLRPAELEANEKGFVNLIVSQMKSPDKWNNTHTIYVDDFVPAAREPQNEVPF